MPLGREVGLGTGGMVLDGTQLPSHKRDTAALPLFGPCLLCCGQTTAWIKMPLGTDEGIGPATLH